AERLAAELAAARAEADALGERARLARELHDSVGHALTLTTLQAGAAARVLDGSDPDPAFVRRALEAIADAGRAALADLDHVLGLLRDGPAGTAPQPVLADLTRLLDRTRAAGVRVDAEVQGDLAAVPPLLGREGYRLVQEALTNALRHAGPVPVRVRVVVDTAALRLAVTNPLSRTRGRPRAGGRVGARGPSPGGGRGLAGMRERVAVLGGVLDAGPDGDTWRVVARLPLPPGG
ncbi:MAG TPA: histidine kinase, partial [Pseudonocardia sp.]|nr:histidine kinase [Pseudonocardia sp.]